MDDPAIESGGFRARRRMLVAAKMLVGTVEVGIVDFSQRLPGCSPNPLRTQIHDHRGIHEIGTQFCDRKDIVRRKLAGAFMARADVEGEFRPILPQAAFTVEEKLSALVDVGSDPDIQCLVDPDVIGKDEKFVSLKALLAIDYIE